MKMQRKRKTQVISLTSYYRIPVCQGGNASSERRGRDEAELDVLTLVRARACIISDRPQ